MKTFVSTQNFGENTFFIKEMFEFELNIFNFMYIDDVDEKIYDYKYNVYDIKKKGFLKSVDVKNPIKLKFNRIKDCNIKIDKIV